MSHDASRAATDSHQDVPLPPSAPGVPSYILQSLLVTLCCCPPVGLIALTYSFVVRARLARHDPTAAHEASQQAHRWIIAAFVTGVLTQIALVLLQIATEILGRI